MKLKEILKFCGALLLSVVLVACNSDEDECSIAFDREAVFLTYGETVTVHFTSDAQAYTFTTMPKGWEDPLISTQNRTITIKAPAAAGDDVAVSGNIVLRGQRGDEYKSASLFVSLDTPEVDWTNEPANCYIANKPGANYRFNASLKGDGQTRIPTKRVAVLWQTSMSLVRYLALEEDGSASFFLDASSSDESQIKQGNAVIGAFDEQDNLLWSWHIWIANFDPEADAIDCGDYLLMDRQLGALQNGNSDQAEILASYGLYYQWGRKDPFVGPATWNASKGTSFTIFDGDSNTVHLTLAESNGETGTYAYTNANPTHFITTTQNDAAWQSGSVPTVWEGVNSPAPYGWEVAPAEAFEGFEIVEDLTVDGATYENNYGWTLRKGESEGFFFAAGRRLYADAMLQNVFDESLTRNPAYEAQPWVGYNWTSDGRVFAFWLDKTTPTNSGLRNDLKMGGANAMSVRCIKRK